MSSEAFQLFKLFSEQVSKHDSRYAIPVRETDRWTILLALVRFLNSLPRLRPAWLNMELLGEFILADSSTIAATAPFACSTMYYDDAI